MREETGLKEEDKDEKKIQEKIFGREKMEDPCLIRFLLALCLVRKKI